MMAIAFVLACGPVLRRTATRKLSGMEDVRDRECLLEGGGSPDSFAYSHGADPGRWPGPR